MRIRRAASVRRSMRSAATGPARSDPESVVQHPPLYYAIGAGLITWSPDRITVV